MKDEDVCKAYCAVHVNNIRAIGLANSRPSWDQVFDTRSDLKTTFGGLRLE